MRTSFAVLLAAAALGGGCVTYDPQAQQREAARKRAEQDRLDARFAALESKVDGLAAAQESLARQIDVLKAAPRQDGMREKLADLEARLKGLDGQREELRRQIVEDITKRVADLVRMQAAQPGPTPPAPPPRHPEPVKREHVVKLGDTLSKIAAAYKTTVPALLKANSLADANSVKVGQRLVIPE